LVLSPDGLGFYILYLYHIFKKMVLSSQATISIENARLYQNLEDKAVESGVLQGEPHFQPPKRSLPLL
jgi:hypothetical protein